MPNLPEKIENIANTSLRITWDDGKVCEYGFRRLRQACPCALCKDEWTGKQLLDPETVPEDIQANNAEIVGNYALAFRFSDGHSTGVFTFEFLRNECGK